MNGERHVVVIGGGIAGLSAALALLDREDAPSVTVLESADRLGGKIRATPFAGLPAVDEGADAYLVRVPWAVELARRVGLGDSLANPATGQAAIWHPDRPPRLHPIPAGLVLGVPTGVASLARSHLLTWSGKLRAATEVLLPKRHDASTSLGAWIRGRFGDQVHERLVDPLVGSIYASDTDRVDVCIVPQLAELIGERSLLLAARGKRPTAAAGPVFEAPRDGVGALVDATAAAIVKGGGELRTASPVRTIERVGERYLVDDVEADAVVLAVPAPAAASLLERVAAEACGGLATWEYSTVVLVTVSVDAPEGALRGSGYLVPKPVQRLVTAASFTSNKWAHLRPPDGSALVRISLGRDGLPVDHLDDEHILSAAISEVGGHLGIAEGRFDAGAARISRWPAAFPQYRPGHQAKVASVRRQLQAAAPGVVLAGAAYDGIGIPACVRQGREAAEAVYRLLSRVRE